MHPLRTLLALLVALFVTPLCPAHDDAEHAPARDDGLIADWTFVPRYTLGASAANLPEGRNDPLPKAAALLEKPTAPVLLNGQQPTQRITNLLDGGDLPKGAFTVEWWINNHAKEPYGALIAARERDDAGRVAWALTYDHNIFGFAMRDDEANKLRAVSLKTERYKGHREYWWHAVAVYDGEKIRFYLNAEQISEIDAPAELAALDKPQLELAAYMADEPYMQWANLVHDVRIHDKPLGSSDISSRYASLVERVSDGRLHDAVFHYTAPPYLNHATMTGMNVLWETDRPSTAEIRWGTTAELDNVKRFDEAKRLHELTIDGLKADTPYFYRVVCQDTSGKTIDSGLLTFRTAVRPGQAFKFVVIGDTESRPHINHRLSELIWQERPNFVINVGDLTDGGREGHRWQWTHEYFVGLGALHGRVPLFPVPGNGEGDLVWYKHYHHLPNGEAYYNFRFGDAEFFMLDSNQREHAFKPGGVQNTWLNKHLSESEAIWKFAAHHHATYTSEENDYGDRWEGDGTDGDPLMKPLVDVYETHDLDIVFFGHLHLYERSRPIREGKHDAEHGVVHLLAGGGGGNLEDFAPTGPAFSDKTFRGHHYVLVSIEGRKLTGKMFDTEGRLRDHFMINKPAPIPTANVPTRD